MERDDVYEQMFAEAEAEGELEMDDVREAAEAIGKIWEEQPASGMGSYTPVYYESEGHKVTVTEDALNSTRSYNAQDKGTCIVPEATIIIEQFPGACEVICESDAQAIRDEAYCGHCLEMQQPGDHDTCINIKGSDVCGVVLAEWKPEGIYGRLGLRIATH